MNEPAGKRDGASQPTHPSPSQLAQRRGSYGVDAPYVPLILVGFGAIGLVLGILNIIVWRSNPWAIVGFAYATFFLLSAASYLYSTRAGKFRVWATILTDLRLRGDERALDLGCGRGAVLLTIAQLLPQGKATGVDIWQARDQSGNNLAATESNARAEGVADRVELLTADMRELPFPDASFDLIVSSLAIHNIPAKDGRVQAIAEAARVLTPGGRLRIADFRHVDAYATQLRALGWRDVTKRNLGWRFWYGGPWAAVYLLSATKPA
jgi:ubiquinone/menaquinone biosynthesis C-methylase UbiE